VMAFTSASSTPLWTYSIPGLASPSEDASALCTLTGNTIVVTVNMQVPHYNHARIYSFTSVQSSTPTVSFMDFENNTFARISSLSTDGTVVAVVLDATVKVVDLTTKTVRMEDNFDFSTDALCMSHDGTYLAYGFQDFDLFGWQNNKYVQLGNLPISGYYAGLCAISDNHNLAIAYYRGDFHQNIVSMYKLQAATPSLLWVYKYPSDNGSYQDVPVQMAMANNGQAVAMATWGDGRSSPTISVFQTSIGLGPIYTYKTPGSMFAVDLYIHEHVVYVTACGKHVHANIMGEGGDVFAISIPLI